MTFVRKRNKIPVFCWFIVDSLYRELLFFIITILAIETIDFLRMGEVRTIHMLDFICELHKFILIQYPAMAVGVSIPAIRSAITQITFDFATSTIHVVYYGAGSFFIKKKTMTFHFSQFKYCIAQSKVMSFRHCIVPTDTPVAIYLFQENQMLRLNCNIGWTRQQFREIEQTLRAIKPPDQDIYIY